MTVRPETAEWVRQAAETAHRDAKQFPEWAIKQLPKKEETE